MKVLRGPTTPGEILSEEFQKPLGLTQRGFSVGAQVLVANIGPSALALNLYVRCRGSQDPPLRYFGLKVPQTEGDKGKAPT